MIYLTIDTSAGISVGVCETELGDVRVLEERSTSDPRHHAEFLTPYVKEALAAAGVERPDAVIVGTGPAAFTGLRAGLVTGRTLATVWDVPIYGLSSLEVLALAGIDAGANIVVPIIDARRKEVYSLRARVMGPDDLEVLEEAQVAAPADVAREVQDQEAVVVTNDANPDLYADVFTELESVHVSPALMVRLLNSRLARREAGEQVDLGTEPQYLRRPDVHAGAHAQPQAQGNPYGLQ